jgi:hypothetical protein
MQKYEKIQVKFKELSLEVWASPEHEWVLETSLVALGYGTSIDTILAHKKRNADELIENKHFLTADKLSVVGQKPNQVYWTKRGVIRLGFFIKSDRAKQFRDWAEDLIIEQPAKPLTPSELILQQAQALVLQERAIADLQAKQNLLEEKVHQVESHQTTLNKDYYSLAGYYNLQKVRWNLSPAQAQQTGKKCKKVSEELGYDHFKTQDARFGMVGLYHLHVLKAVLGF